MQNYIMELYVPVANRSGKCSYFLYILRVYFLILNTVANLIKGCRVISLFYDKLKFYCVDIAYRMYEFYFFYVYDNLWLYYFLSHVYFMNTLYIHVFPSRLISRFKDKLIIIWFWKITSCKERDKINCYNCE